MIHMAEEREPIEDIEADDVERDRELNRKLSSQNPDRVEDVNRSADNKRERYSRANYYESLNGEETERKTRDM